MPANPIQYNVINALITALQDIKIANDYHYDVANESITTATKSLVEFNGGIDLVLEVGKATKRAIITNKYEVSQDFSVIGFKNIYSEDSTAQLQITKLISDIEKALMKDTTLSDTACDMDLKGHETLFAEHSEPTVVVSVDFRVKYRHTFNNPNTNV